jgi:uncharacterized membrane protein YoaK (UPF0700 family)
MTGTLTFVITGHMTRITNQVVDRLSRTAGRKELISAATKKEMVVILSFFGGAMMGCAARVGMLHAWIWNRSFTIMGILYGMLFLWKDREALKSKITESARL